LDGSPSLGKELEIAHMVLYFENIGGEVRWGKGNHFRRVFCFHFKVVEAYFFVTVRKN
jgi:hypothetical protein